MTLSQRKLVWSWVIGSITLLIAAYLLVTNNTYAWVIPMFIGMAIVKYLRYGIDSGEKNIFHFMSERMKLFTAIYSLFLAGFVAYSVITNPDLVGKNTGIFMILALAPFIIVGVKIDLKLFRELGERNA